MSMSNVVHVLNLSNGSFRTAEKNFGKEQIKKRQNEKQEGREIFLDHKLDTISIIL